MEKKKEKQDKSMIYVGDTFTTSFIMQINFEDLNNTVIDSDVLEFCGFRVMATVYLEGVDNLGEYVSVKLFNLSEKALRAEYTVSLLPRVGRERWSWTDPEGIVEFDAKNGVNSSWGADDFIEVSCCIT